MINQVSIAQDLAKERHKGQRYNGGDYYENHLQKVADCVAGEIKAVAYLHDILEDTPTTETDLRWCGVADGIIKSVKLLTRPADTNYSDYIETIATSGDIGAMLVKWSDLCINYDLSISNSPSLAKRYKKARDRIIDALIDYQQSGAGAV